MLLVVGSPNSSNSNRLRELAERMGTPAYLIDGAEDLKQEWFAGVAAWSVGRNERARAGRATGECDVLDAERVAG